MVSQPPIRESEAANWEFFLKIPETDRKILSPSQVKDVQLLRPLFEFSGACSGCGETPYVKLMTQDFFGDRMLIGNATGCSSIYGGNLPISSRDFFGIKPNQTLHAYKPKNPICGSSGAGLQSSAEFS